MKKLSVVMIIFLFSTPIFAKDTINVVYFNSFPPFSWEDNTQAMQGILIDVLNEAIQNRIGISVSHKGYPWARAQKMVKDGDADAFVTVPTPERRTYTEISNEPVIISTFTLFVKKDNPKIKEFNNVKTIADLKPFKIGHYIGSGWAEKNLAGMNVDLASSLDSTLTKLVNSRFEVFVDVSQVIRYKIKEMGLKDQIVELPNTVDSTSFNLCIGKQSQFIKIIPQFDEVIKKMKDEGKLQEIYDKYK